MPFPARHVEARDGRDKTRLIHALIERWARDLRIRDLAQRLIKGAKDRDHLDRMRRIHSYVANAVPYVREPSELFQDPWHTLTLGGDCDCKTIALGALWRSLKYPVVAVPVGDPSNPAHYAPRLGYPESDAPHGCGETRWLWAETIVPGAKLGEAPHIAARRLSA